MKANKAPDFPEKVYIPRDPEYPQFPDLWWERESDGSNIEYIRTDAFIEKAVEYIANNMRCDGYTLQTKAKFIKDFKNYMKGE